jgi:hypothetical protein
VFAATSKPEQDKPDMIENIYFNGLQLTNSRSGFVLKPSFPIGWKKLRSHHCRENNNQRTVHKGPGPAVAAK